MDKLYKTFFILSVFSLFGCAERIKHVDESFNGISSLFENTNQVTIVHVHGMGVHLTMNEDKSNGADDQFISTLVENLGFDSNVFIEDDLITLYINDIHSGAVVSRQYENDDRYLNYFEINWDQATRNIQTRLLELPANYFPNKADSLKYYNKAVYLNRELKYFVDSHLADAVIYIGDLREALQDMVIEGLSHIVSQRKSDVVVLIADSLGSTLSFDALMKIDTLSEQETQSRIRETTKGSASYRNVLEDVKVKTIPLDLETYSLVQQNLSEKIKQMYLNANQLPLLEMGRIGYDDYPIVDPGVKEIRPHCKVEDNKRVLDTSSQYQIVSFSDYNDALSYTVTDNFVNDFLCLTESKAHWVNVEVKNGRSILGIIVWPTHAHTSGFKRFNKEGIRLIAHGCIKSDSGKCE